jgi:hypothetical protein
MYFFGQEKNLRGLGIEPTAIGLSNKQITVCAKKQALANFHQNSPSHNSAKNKHFFKFPTPVDRESKDLQVLRSKFESSVYSLQ